MPRSGRRSYARSVAPCAPGGCGARIGEPCRAYRDTVRHGPASGEPVTDIHAARWRAFRAWLADPGRHAQPAGEPGEDGGAAWIPPADLDPEVLALCRAVNQLPGLTTVESCSGHGESPVHVWVAARGLDALPQLAYWLARCHTGLDGWQLTVSTDCGMNPVVFLIEGPRGAFAAADQIAGLIADYAARAINDMPGEPA